MSSAEPVILVVSHSEVDACRLKELIEFLDSPDVRICEPDVWKHTLGNARLEALFVGADLSDAEVDTLLGGIGALDRSVPIIMINDTGSA